MSDDEVRSIWIWQPLMIGKPCEAIVQFDGELAKLVGVLFECCAMNHAYGVAAPQVGIFFQVSVIDNIDGQEPLAICNPKWEPISDVKLREREGCLSFPGRGFHAQVERYRDVRLTYQNPKGEAKTLEATGLLARCIQHECDHLEGKFYIDYISPFQRKLIVDKLGKRINRSNRRQRQAQLTGKV